MSERGIRNDAALVIFWDYDTQWGADRSRSSGGAKDWGLREFTATERLLELHARHAVAACFAIVGAAALPGERPYHDPGQIRAMHAAGHEVASHSFRHEWLPGIGWQGLLATLRDSKCALEQCIGAPVTTFVPPYNQPFDYAARLAPSLSERRTVPSDRISLRRMCEALGETGFRTARVSYRTLVQRVLDRAARRRIDGPVAIERIAGIACVRLNTAGGFAADAIAMVERTVSQGGIAVVYGHPHSLDAGNSQDARWLVPFLERVAEHSRAGRLRVVLPRELT